MPPEDALSEAVLLFIRPFSLKARAGQATYLTKRFQHCDENSSF